jgi:hypothetical protein
MVSFVNDGLNDSVVLPLAARMSGLYFAQEKERESLELAEPEVHMACNWRRQHTQPRHAPSTVLLMFMATADDR